MKLLHTLYMRTGLAMAVLTVVCLTACTSMNKQHAAAAPAKGASAPVDAASKPVVAATQASAVSKTPSVADMALADGLKSYQAGQYRQAESQFKTALLAGLKTPADVAQTNKHLAFIYCMSKRDAQCAAAFKAAKAADANFALSKTEAGHPMWAKTYQKALGLKPPVK